MKLSDIKTVNVKCFLRGHEPADYTDSGFLICGRCGSHEWYEGSSLYGSPEFERWNFTLDAFFYRIKGSISHWAESLKYRFYQRCSCGKVERILFFKKGEHRDCLPF